MSETANASRRVHVPLAAPVVFCLIALAARPAVGSAPDGDASRLPFRCAPDADESMLPGSFLTFGELPAAGAPEERIAAYEKALDWTPDADGGPRQRPVFGFVEVAVDFSALADPEDALAAARALAPAPPTAVLYERLGVVLLSAARQARFGDQLDRARGHLRAARHVFALADSAATAGDSTDRDPNLLHRAMVGLEEILVTGSRDAWPETGALLSRQIELTPEGPRAAWARRMLDDPATYVGEEEVCFERNYHVGGDLKRPQKIFAPPPRYTTVARKARIQGMVIIQAVIDRHGSVAGLKVIKGLPMGLDDEALRVMATWLFEPAKLYGEPVSVFYNLTMNFRL